ncbi:MAG: NUDIX domain-containing protein [Patescibacteria group bacterium]|nr:NUDIX domain-containing protein [Patescibacteria group bacterium]
MNQTILACSENGQFLEYIPKEIGHTGEGRRHLAVTVLVYNKRGEILLQRRKHEVFNDIWDFTASTHPLHKSDGLDETVEEATMRALKEEYEIEDISVKKVGEFNYFAKIGPLCENEHDVLLVGEYNGEVKLNPDVGYEYKWVDKKEFLKDFNTDPDNYTPWTKEAVRILKETGKFF